MEQSAATGQLLPTPLPSECPSLSHPKGWGIQRGLRASVTVVKAILLGSIWGCSAGVSPPFPRHGAVPAQLSHQHQPQGTPHSSLGGHSHHHHGPGTHNVRNLGMWLKLDTGIEVILLLFRVLQEDKEGQVRVNRL